MKVTKINYNKNLKSLSGRKQSLHYAYKGLIIYKSGIINEVVDLRLYSTPSRVYACVWIRAEGTYSSASDYAGGGGYDFCSTAAADAFKKAGVEFDENWGGRGSGAIREAINAILDYTLKGATDYIYPELKEKILKTYIVESYP